ncbi:hypothetical protein NDU88_000151 [Pleurodeles waltl]|uniref:Uncharacterized protein n=1 Tax=Pleurodeles waltl TaxID=8319 RepID=A0AAV7TEM4_PLEWA|nr:hypothetical protein NDU88_000151 [Pleurodeles waltl]
MEGGKVGRGSSGEKSHAQGGAVTKRAAMEQEEMREMKEDKPEESEGPGMDKSLRGHWKVKDRKGLVREITEAVLVSDGGIDLATSVACPLNMDKYKQLPLIDGVQVEAYRDTGASVTMVMEKLVAPEQHLLGHQYQVTDAHSNTVSHPMAVVNLNWGGGVTGPKKVVVATDLPVKCLLGNDLETSAWAEVEVEAHVAMLGIPGHIFALTRAQAKKQRSQGDLDLGIMDQVLPKARGKKGKPLSTIPPSTDDSPFEEEDFSPCAELTPEEL